MNAKSNKLAGKIAIVTGASKGIGAAITQLLVLEILATMQFRNEVVELSAKVKA